MVIEEQVRIRVIRAIIGWDMKKIAARLDVNPNTVTNWERGRSVPNSSNRRVLAEICHENGIGFRADGYPVLEG
jgi:DNA-binding transcriptional regulator YiaG